MAKNAAGALKLQRFFWLRDRAVELNGNQYFIAEKSLINISDGKK